MYKLKKVQILSRILESSYFWEGCGMCRQFTIQRRGDRGGREKEGRREGGSPSSTGKLKCIVHYLHEVLERDCIKFPSRDFGL